MGLALRARRARARARRGHRAATPLLTRAHAYAASVLADPTEHAIVVQRANRAKPSCGSHALDALAAAGDHRTTFLGDVDAQRDEARFADQARLARLLANAPGYGAAASAAAKTIEDHAVRDGAAARVVNLPGRYRWCDDPVVAQAEALRLELARNADGETIDRLTRSLLDMRRNGSFGCACENAAALDALVDLAARERPANFTATATIAGKPVARDVRRPRAPRSAPRTSRCARCRRAAAPSRSRRTAPARCTTRSRTRTVSPANAPGRLNGLRVTRVVREANTTPVLATMGLLAATDPLTLSAAHVFDVELQIIADHPVERVLITDPLPAGFEAVDTSFATTSKALTTPSTDWKIGDQQIRTDRIEAYADYLDAGIYRLHYLARSVTPGTFAWPGAEAHLIDRPDEFGRSSTTSVVVK